MIKNKQGLACFEASLKKKKKVNLPPGGATLFCSCHQSCAPDCLINTVCCTDDMNNYVKLHVRGKPDLGGGSAAENRVGQNQLASWQWKGFISLVCVCVIVSKTNKTKNKASGKEMGRKCFFLTTWRTVSTWSMAGRWRQSNRRRLRWQETATEGEGCHTPKARYP